MLLYVFFLCWAILVAHAEEVCSSYEYYSQDEVPKCVDGCLVGKYVGSVCASNLGVYCTQEAAIDYFFQTYMGCIIQWCVDDGDIYHFMLSFRDECEGTPNGPLTKLNDASADEYLQVALKHESTITVSATTAAKSSAFTWPVTSSDVTSGTTSSTSKPGESTQQPSEPPSSSSPPPASSSVPPSQAPSTTSQAGVPTLGVSPSLVNTANVNGAASSTTAPGHTHSTTTVLAAPKPADTNATAPALSTTAIAGTAAGGTVGIAFIIGLIFLFLRRHKRQSSLASSADIWEPSRNTSPKPKLPNIGNDSSFGRYSEMEACAPVRQRSKAELHSEEIPSPRPQTGYYRPPEMSGGGNESARYYQSAQRPEPHRHGSNIDYRYPELSSHAVTSIPSPTSPISQTSTMQGWNANSTSGAPTIRLSSADLRSEGVRSPVSELGTNAPLRSTRSAELHGAGTMSPTSELGTDSFHGVGHGAAELHNEPLLPPQLDSRSQGNVPDGVAEMEDSNMHRGDRPGVSTNF